MRKEKQKRALRRGYSIALLYASRPTDIIRMDILRIYTYKCISIICVHSSTAWKHTHTHILYTKNTMLYVHNGIGMKHSNKSYKDENINSVCIPTENFLNPILKITHVNMHFNYASIFDETIKLQFLYVFLMNV